MSKVKVKVALVLEVEDDIAYGPQQEELFCSAIEDELNDLLYEMADTVVKQIKVKVV